MSTAPLAAFGQGIATHLLYFKHGEHHRYPWRIISAYAVLYLVGVSVLVNYGNLAPTLALSLFSQWTACYFVGLFGSLLTYRTFFNPLNNIPGPFLARITKFNDTFSNAKRLNECHNLMALHKKHGQFVRTGPNDISCTFPDAPVLLQGSASRATKGPWYDIDYPYPSMQMVRDRAAHARRRKIWQPAFADKAVRGYEHRITPLIDAFAAQMRARCDTPVDLSLWFYLFSFDVMGDLAFGRPFDMIANGAPHPCIATLSEGMRPLGFGLPDWALRLLGTTPGLSAPIESFHAYCRELLAERMVASVEPEHPDVMATLLEHFNSQSPSHHARAGNLKFLQGDSRLLVIAGSDTTSATLTHLFYYLARDPTGLQSRLRSEIEQRCASTSGEITNAALLDAPLLNGAIHEALRLHPPVPSGVLRTTPREGLQIGPRHLPAFTTVKVPSFVLGRDDSVYTRALEFLPERWGASPELVANKNAFAPFALGPDMCIGKGVAFMEIRLLTARVLREFEVRLAEGESGERLLGGSLDHFTVTLGGLDVVFGRR